VKIANQTNLADIYRSHQQRCVFQKSFDHLIDNLVRPEQTSCSRSDSIHKPISDFHFQLRALGEVFSGRDRTAVCNALFAGSKTLFPKASKDEKTFAAVVNAYRTGWMLENSVDHYAHRASVVPGQKPDQQMRRQDYVDFVNFVSGNLIGKFSGVTEPRAESFASAIKIAETFATRAKNIGHWYLNLLLDKTSSPLLALQHKANRPLSP